MAELPADLWWDALLSQDLQLVEELMCDWVFQPHEGIPSGDAVMFCAFHDLPSALGLLLGFLQKQNVPFSDFGSQNGVTGLMYACMRNNPECASLLLFQQQACTKKGVTAAMLAAIYNAPACLELVAPFETGFHTRERVFALAEGATALQFAAHYRSKQCVDILLGLELIENEQETLKTLQESGYLSDGGFGAGCQVSVSLKSMASVNRIVVQMMSQIIQAAENSQVRALAQSSRLQKSQQQSSSSPFKNVADSYQTPARKSEANDFSELNDLTRSQLKQSKVAIQQAVKSPTRLNESVAQSGSRLTDNNDLVFQNSAVMLSQSGWPTSGKRKHKNKHPLSELDASPQVDLSVPKAEQIPPPVAAPEPEVLVQCDEVESEPHAQPDAKPPKKKVSEAKALAAFVRKNKGRRK